MPRCKVCGRHILWAEYHARRGYCAKCVKRYILGVSKFETE